MRTMVLLALKVIGGLLVAGVVLGILMPLLPGMMETWMMVVVAVICVGGILLATSSRSGRPPIE